eukprot:TRINITY_DN36456_c0_g1_i2.p1 TRINITY_DN36456_c0_g1~~TRINITY_DN36456_c0_g1_i2.p1  ORF type:complete len:218 (-),score=49.60 TRINITY_DN36456_c0_g1_i2:29-682(-)
MAAVLNVFLLSGRLLKVHAEADWTWRHVKESLEASAGVPSREQRLLLGSQEVVDTAKVVAAAIASAAVVAASSNSSERRPTISLTLVRRPVEQASWLEKVNSAGEGHTLGEAPESIRGDREVVLAALRSSKGRAIEYAHEELKADAEVALETLRCGGAEMLWQFADSLLADRLFAVEATREDGRALAYLSDELKARIRRYVMPCLPCECAPGIGHRA